MAAVTFRDRRNSRSIISFWERKRMDKGRKKSSGKMNTRKRTEYTK